MVYEAILLFGVVFFADLVIDLITQSRHALALRNLRQVWLFLVIGSYFAYFWCRSGQTLPMQTWRIKVVTTDGTRLPFARAVARYLLAWMWILPSLALTYALGLQRWSMLGVVVLGMLLWAMTIRLNPDRQFLHDKLAGTRLINSPAPVTSSN